MNIGLGGMVEIDASNKSPMSKVWSEGKEIARMEGQTKERKKLR